MDDQQFRELLDHFGYSWEGYRRVRRGVKKRISKHLRQLGCRSIDEYNKIKKMVEYSGKSESTFIREILLGAEKKESQSFNSGYAQAFNKFALACPKCGKNIIFDLINDPEAAKKISETFRNYVHCECLEIL